MVSWQKQQCARLSVLFDVWNSNATGKMTLPFIPLWVDKISLSYILEFIQSTCT